MKSLTNCLAGAFLFALAAPLATSPALAQSAEAPAQQADGFDRMLEAITSDTMSELIFERDFRTVFIAVIKADPEMTQIEADCPGYVEGLGNALRPIMRVSHDYDWQWYRREFEALMRSGLSEEHAAGIADLFGSPLGQRFIAAAIANSNADATVAAIGDDPDAAITMDALQADKSATARAVIDALSPEDMNEFATRMREAEWLPTFMRIQPRLEALQLELANRDFTPEHGAEFDKVLANYSSDQLEACYGGK